MEVLIHELLHHSQFTLYEDEVLRLATEFTANDDGRLLPRYEIANEPDDFNPADRRGFMAGIADEQGDEFIQSLWLAANGLSQSTRSPVTGRFVKRESR
jgi:hypothetical protein